MRLSPLTTIRRNRAIVAALAATLFLSVSSHAQATAQPAKPPAPKTSAAPAAPAQPPATKATPATRATPASPTVQKAVPASAAPRGLQPAAKPNQPIKPKRVYIDINHATLKELKNIPGIGDVYGKKIIAGRPYANKSQLVSRNIIDANLYDTIQGMIIAKQ